MNFTYIGKIKTPFKSFEGMPIQSSMAKGIKGEIILNQEFVSGLKDIEGFSHILLLYHFYKAADYSLEVVPFMDSKPNGVFATRAPLRPNFIGFSIENYCIALKIFFTSMMWIWSTIRR
ncbi:MAG TPA: TrmO family methyltransferase [Bacteroidales bacterium]|nr:TrmO family methyltransferase [Bacteroidales bacterium]HPS26732.1 TrmO family methyltransferase [Bacteroidales bacterium]HQI69951.1 TrmO family methyltransferase [Bacteroidales bacterium]